MGSFYPPSSIHSMLCGLLRYLRSNNPGCPNFLDKKDYNFTQLHNTLDSPRWSGTATDCPSPQKHEWDNLGSLKKSCQYVWTTWDVPIVVLPDTTTKVSGP